MDGVHDLGGKPGYGAVDIETNEPAFHERWEAIVFCWQAAVRKAGVVKNVDQFRHAVERINPQAYLEHSYYGRWLGGLETLLREAGVLTEEEISKGVTDLGGSLKDLVAAQPMKLPDPVDYQPSEPYNQRPLSVVAKFICGARVRTNKDSKPGHTRLPEYARGKVGCVVACHNGWVYPDSNAHGHGEAPQHLYTVQFTGKELWGSEDSVTVHLDLFEDYLEII